MKTKQSKTTDEKQISYASNKMCEIQKVLVQLWNEDADAIRSHMSYYRYKDKDARIPIGITIILCLNPTLYYPNNVLNLWKKRLKAQDFAVGIEKSHLRVVFHIKFKDENEGAC